MKKLNYYLTLIFALMLLLTISCAVRKQTIRKVTYVNTCKDTESIGIIKLVPKLELLPEINQTQIKGGVSVSCEHTPFSLERTEEHERNITYADPEAPGYDVYEITTKPKYFIRPYNLIFKISIKNNQDRVLKLIDVPIILIIDGTQSSIPDEALVDWKAALIVKGFEKEFLMNGPQLDKLSVSKTLYIAVHDVPVLYDNAGNVTKKDNFEWTYQISNEEVLKPDKIRYSYEKEIVQREKCYSCNGTGIRSQEVVKCYYCNPVGSGYVTDKQGNRTKCTTCNGTGTRTLTEKCYICGGIGSKLNPKSPQPKIASEIIWTGWNVNVETNPTGAKVSVVDINTGEYKNTGLSNIKVDWFSSSAKTFPILIDYQGKEVKVLPFRLDGKELNIVRVDYTIGNEPRILMGKKVE